MNESSEITIKDAMLALRAALDRDPDYARGWHDNLACAAMDEGISHQTANPIAARFMFNTFGVRTGNHVGIKPEEWPNVIE